LEEESPYLLNYRKFLYKTLYGAPFYDDLGTALQGLSLNYLNDYDLDDEVLQSCQTHK
jgi:hypothetical protein